MGKGKKALVYPPNLSLLPKSGSITQQILDRKTPELVFAFCGAVGSGISFVRDKINKLLVARGYQVEIVKVSSLIEQLSEKLYPTQFKRDEVADKGPNRTMALQDFGNKLRKDNGSDILMQIVVAYIGRVRKEKDKGHWDEKIPGKPIKVAWLIDSLKNPAEVELLRMVYGGMFYLFGILCPEDIREERLIGRKRFNKGSVRKVIEKDESEVEGYGQQLLNTIHHADFFVRNFSTSSNALESALERYLDVLFGKNLSPSLDEYAMYMAKSASMRSSCLSRQVGASIFSKDGEFIAAGCNDVPKFGGGLYCPDDSEDGRCAYLPPDKGGCRNNHFKEEFHGQVRKVIQEGIGNEKLALQIAERIFRETPIKNITEYSRSVHAEMDAIVSAARNSSVSLKGAFLYCTTFPCHSCARHIIAAGIAKVFYIEPYEKSQALRLHGDAIISDPDSKSKVDKFVCFIPFQGVAPRQYLSLFQKHGERKDENGQAISVEGNALPVNAIILDNHIAIESKIIESLVKRKLMESK